MTRRILVSRSPGETRAAVVADDEVTDLAVDRDFSPSLAGTVHVARLRGRLGASKNRIVELADGEAFLPAADSPGHPLPAEGSLIAVQLVSHPAPGKRPRATRRLAFGGAGLIYLPGAEGDGVSHRVAETGARAALAKALADLPRPSGGFVARRAAGQLAPETLHAEANRLVGQAAAVLEAAAASAPTALEAGPTGAVIDLLRAALPGADGAIVDDAGLLQELRRGLPPQFAAGLSLHTGGAGAPLFRTERIEAAFEEALTRAIDLPGGGRMTIEATTALTAADIDTAAATGSSAQVNLQALTELARQMRLRNLSGAIVADLVGQPEGDGARALADALGQAVSGDPRRVDVGRVSRLGLLEISRERVHPPLAELCLEASSPRLSPESMALAALREARDAALAAPGKPVEICGSGALVTVLNGPFAPLLEQMRRDLRQDIAVTPKPEWACDRVEIVANAAAHD